MPRPLATAEQKDEARQRIRKAAAEIYNQEGQSGVSARSIAKHAGVSVGTIYTYFGSLRGLMETLWTGPVTRLEQDLKDVAQATLDPLDRIRALLKTYVKFARDNSEIYRGVFLFVRPLSMPKDEGRPSALTAALPALLSRAITEGQAAGTLKAGNAEDSALMLWGALHGCLALPLNFGRLEFERMDAVISALIETAISGLLADNS